MENLLTACVLSTSLFLTGCGGSNGDSFVGKWFYQDVAKKGFTKAFDTLPLYHVIVIEKKNDNYLGTSFIGENLETLKKQHEKILTLEKNNRLCEDKVICINYDKTTDTVYTDGGGNGDLTTYKRVEK